MDTSVALDVDGTLRSPLIFALVFSYSAAVAGLTVASVSLWFRGGRSRLVAAAIAVSIVLACSFNFVWVRAIAAAVIESSSQAGVHVGVGFFGSHPSWLAPAIGLTAGILVSARVRRVRAAVV